MKLGVLEKGSVTTTKGPVLILSFFDACNIGLYPLFHKNWVVFCFVRPWQDGWSVHSVSSHRHAVAAELVEHRAGCDRATPTAECREVLWRIQRPPGQRMTLRCSAVWWTDGGLFFSGSSGWHSKPSPISWAFYCDHTTINDILEP